MKDNFVKIKIEHKTKLQLNKLRKKYGEEDYSKLIMKLLNWGVK